MSHDEGAKLAELLRLTPEYASFLENLNAFASLLGNEASSAGSPLDIVTVPHVVMPDGAGAMHTNKPG